LQFIDEVAELDHLQCFQDIGRGNALVLFRVGDIMSAIKAGKEYASRRLWMKLTSQLQINVSPTLRFQAEDALK
jgi:ribosome-binding factor A